MAISKIREEIKGLYESIHPDKSMRSRTARRAQDRRFAFEYTINANNYAEKMSAAINILADDENFTTANELLPHVREVLKNIKGFVGKSTFIQGNENEVTINRTSPKGKIDKALVEKINRRFRHEVLKRWKTQTEKGQGATGIDNQSIVAGKDQAARDRRKLIGFSHNEESNVANATLLQFILETDVPIDLITRMDRKNVAMVIFEALDIQWFQKMNPMSKKNEWIIVGELAGKNEDYQRLKDLGQPWEDEIIRRLQKAVKDSKFVNRPDERFSKPFLDVVSEEAVREIAKPYKKVRGGKLTGLPKKNKKSTRRGRVKNPFKAPKSKTIKVSGATNIAQKRFEKGATGLTEEGAIQLARIRKYIQGRLPAEVRRNMGRPALINQTGRFSNSVQLLSLMEGKNTIIAKYTYLLRPYETFENTGKKRWPLGYNPKTLIAKSIRNLAEGRISQKLTVRRV
jgi:hypothetical protein